MLTNLFFYTTILEFEDIFFTNVTSHLWTFVWLSNYYFQYFVTFNEIFKNNFIRMFSLLVLCWLLCNSTAILSRFLGQPHTNFNISKLYWCSFMMSSMTEKSPKDSSWENSAKITEIKAQYFVPIVFLWLYSIYSHISARILLRTKLNILFKSSHKDKSFGT